MKFLTVSAEKAQQIREISSKFYFPFGVTYLTIKYCKDIEENAFYITISGKIHTSEYFSELLAHWSVDNNDVQYNRYVSQILGISNLFEAKLKHEN